MKRACLALFLALFAVVSAPAQQFQYNTLAQRVIEVRLKTYKEKNGEREAQLKQLFTAAGCAEHLSEQPVKGEKLPNVVCVLPGASDSTIMVGAHFDHVELGKGVIDNWSGASLLPSLFQSLSAAPRRHTYVFVGFTEEERGLIGSEFYAKHLSEAERSKISAMINFDSLAMGPPKVWVTHSDKRLVEALARVAGALKIEVAGVNADQVGDEDGHSFMNRKVPTLMLHSVTQENLAVLHSPKDDWAAVKMEDYYASYRLAAAYLAYLDVTLDKEKGAGETRAPSPPKK